MGASPGKQGWFNVCKPNNVIYHINRMKDKNYMIISIDAVKASDKIQHCFIIKTLNKLSYRKNYLKIIKAMYRKLTAYIIINGGKLNYFPLKSRTRQRCLHVQLLFNIVLKVLARAIRQEKEIKTFKSESKKQNYLFVHNMVLHVENSKEE